MIIFSEILIYFFHIQNLKYALLFFENFWGDFLLTLEKKKLTDQSVSDMFSNKYIKISIVLVYNFMSGRIHCGAGPNLAHGARFVQP